MIKNPSISNPYLKCHLSLGALLFALSLGSFAETGRASDWYGTVDSNFQNIDNWHPASNPGAGQPPVAGVRNKILRVMNGSSAPLKYTEQDGATVFGQRLIIGDRSG